MMKIRSFEHWSITTKITVSVILLVLLNVGVSAVDLYSLKQMKKSVEMVGYGSAVMVSVNNAAKRVENFISSHDPSRLDEVKAIMAENVEILAHLDLRELDTVHTEEVSSLKRRMRYFSNTVDVLRLATEMMNTEITNMTRQHIQLQNVAVAIENNLEQRRERLEQRMDQHDAGMDKVYHSHQILQSLRNGAHKMTSVLLLYMMGKGKPQEPVVEIRQALQSMLPVVKMLKDLNDEDEWLAATKQLQQVVDLTDQNVRSLSDDSPTDSNVLYSQMLGHFEVIDRMINQMEKVVVAKESMLGRAMDDLRTETGLLQNSVNVSRRFAERVAHLEAKTLTFHLLSTDEAAASVHETLDQLARYSRILPSVNTSDKTLNSAVTVNSLIDGYRDAFLRFRQASYALSRVHQKVREEAVRTSSLVSQFAQEQQVAAARHNEWSEVSGMVAGVITALTALFIAWSTSRLIARPIVSLAAVMRQLATGHLEVSITGLERQDEVGSMSRAVKVFQENAVKVREMEAEAKSERQRIMSQLEKMVVERTEDLQHKTEELEAQATELNRARIQAEAATHAKSVFLANMSHELRTPLNAILGYAQLMRREPNLDERQHDGLNTIMQSGHHLLTLINDLLDLSKIEAGRLDLTPEAVDLKCCLQSVIDIIRIKASQRGLALKLDIPSQIFPTMFLDEKRLRQVLLNLLGNAVKYTDTGYVRLKVQTEQPATDRYVQVTFSVEDSGIGIADDMQEIIFHPFEQVGDKKRRVAGTGLGLAVSRQLVRQMGGDIQVNSQVGVGSQFYFSLNLLIVEEHCEHKTHISQENIIGYEGERKRVLIVDDIPENRMLLVDLLEEIGFETLEANDGRAGVEQACAERPDLILMDIVMPVMDGLEATRNIRQRSELENIPVLIVSASASNNELAQGEAAGANGFVSKPIDRKLLLALIGKQLDLQWITDEQSAEPELSSIVSDTSGWIAPPREQLEELRHLALIGNMRDIRRWAEALKEGDSRYRTFADHLIDMAKAFQSRSISLLVTDLLERKSAI
ncbi:response regulator [Vibrio mangrovi]|nr:response regulator [Vibrio mangrovi]MDW6003594.1 response regulator [Vibrio mangrovi]